MRYLDLIKFSCFPNCIVYNKDFQVYIDIPDEKERGEILWNLLRDLPISKNKISEAASHATGYVLCDFVMVARSVRRQIMKLGNIENIRCRY